MIVIDALAHLSDNLTDLQHSKVSCFLILIILVYKFSDGFQPDLISRKYCFPHNQIIQYLSIIFQIQTFKVDFPNQAGKNYLKNTLWVYKRQKILIIFKINSKACENRNFHWCVGEYH